MKHLVIICIVIVVLALAFIFILTSFKNKELTTPYTVLGTMGLTGFSDTIQLHIENAVKKYSNEEYVDIVDVVKNNLDVEYEIDYPDSML